MAESNNGDESFLAFSSSSDNNRQKRGHWGNRNSNRGHNRSRHGFGYQNNSYQSTPWRKNNSDQSYQQRQHREFNVHDYIHPSMWEYPWANFAKRQSSESPDRTLFAENLNLQKSPQKENEDHPQKDIEKETGQP